MKIWSSLISAAHSDRIEETTRTVCLKGRHVPVLFRSHPRARKIKLTINPGIGHPVVTFPACVEPAEALSFLHRQADWTLTALAQLPDQRLLANGTLIPYEGKETKIIHCPHSRRGVVYEGDALLVSGEESYLPRRLKDFFKNQARKTITPLVMEKAGFLECTPGRVTIRDQRTRWGSCSAKGDLSFSWRLILAPPEILDYVVCHEVAHLVHMDHSPRFWRTVGKICPDWRLSRGWLETHGAELHRIG